MQSPVYIALVIAIRLVLGGMFLIAGASKLTNRTETRRAFGDFGLPETLLSFLAIAVPVVELVTAAALLIDPLATWGALAATALLMVFTAAVAINLAGGRVPDCGCFGQLSAGPIGPHTLVRNGILTALAAGLFWLTRTNDAPGLLGWVAPLAAAEHVFAAATIVLLGIAAFQGWIYLQLLKQNGRLLKRLDAVETKLGIDASASLKIGLTVGSPAPDFNIPNLDGIPVSLSQLRASGLPVALFFIAPGCTFCHELLPDLGRWNKELAGYVRLAIIGRGDVAENRNLTAAYGLNKSLLLQGGEVGMAYMIQITPSMVLVDANGAVAAPAATGIDEIRSLMISQFAIRTAPSQAPAPPPTIPVGEKAPEIRLPGIDGKAIGLGDFRGRAAALLFWDPDCGFCQKMLPQLREWDSRRPAGAPDLVFVSRGAPNAHRDLNVRATVLLDDGFVAFEKFGVQGTPTGILLDAEGRVASNLNVGFDQAMKMLKGPDASTDPEEEFLLSR